MEIEYKGIAVRTCEDVYEPAEDTFLLMDALEGEIKHTDSVLEVGCGTGIVSIFAARMGRRVTAVDINPHALECTRQNMARNGITNADVIESDLFSSVTGKFDVVIFNTPYVPTEEGEVVNVNGDGAGIERAWDGGRTGREVIERFLADLDAHVNPGVKIFMVESTKSDYMKSMDYLRKNGYSADVKKRLKLFFEELAVIKAIKS